MTLIKFFLQITASLFFFISDSNGILIYSDNKHDDWMVSKESNNKSADLAGNNKSMNFTLSSSDTTKSTDVNIKDQIIKQIDEKLNRTDFSKIEIDKMKIFARNIIKSRSMESLTNSSELIIKNVENLIERYKDHKKDCTAGQTHVGDQSTDYMSEFCFNSFINGFCPHFPIC